MEHNSTHFVDRQFRATGPSRTSFFCRGCPGRSKHFARPQCKEACSNFKDCGNPPHRWNPSKWWTRSTAWSACSSPNAWLQAHAAIGWTCTARGWTLACVWKYLFQLCSSTMAAHVSIGGIFTWSTCVVLCLQACWGRALCEIRIPCSWRQQKGVNCQIRRKKNTALADDQCSWCWTVLDALARESSLLWCAC